MSEAQSTPRDYKWKYQGQNPIERLHDGEPYFFIRAQDSLSGKAVSAYADLLKEAADNARAYSDSLADNILKQALAVQAMANDFLDWQIDNPTLVKEPRKR
jgi:hypothetical protein